MLTDPPQQLAAKKIQFSFIITIPSCHCIINLLRKHSYCFGKLFIVY